MKEKDKWVLDTDESAMDDWRKVEVEYSITVTRLCNHFINEAQHFSKKCSSLNHKIHPKVAAEGLIARVAEILNGVSFEYFEEEKGK